MATNGNSVVMPSRANRFVVPLVALSVSVAAGCSKWGEAQGKPEPPIPPAPAGVQQAKVTVDKKGFVPSEVKLEKGKPALLYFVRTTDETCAKEVVFPELKVEKDLPLNTPVRIDIPTTEARTLTFQCGMAMYKSSVLIQ
jgi:plastocyanin domain-containing protein